MSRYSDGEMVRQCITSEGCRKAANLEIPPASLWLAGKIVVSLAIYFGMAACALQAMSRLYGKIRLGTQCRYLKPTQALRIIWGP